jgi:hypothetical protein
MAVNPQHRYRRPAICGRICRGIGGISIEIWLGLAVAVVSAMAAHALGQPALTPETKGAAAPVEGAILTSNREMVKKLARARKLAEEGRSGEAIGNLDSILEAPEDFFFQPDKKSPVHRSLKAEARRLLGELPPEGRELYELKYGVRASKMLDEALAANDPERLAEVSRRFFHTRSGCQATYLLGLYHLSHGQSLAGALALRRLHEAGQLAGEFEPALSLTFAACWLRSGAVEQARQLLVDLRRRGPMCRLMIAGREVPLFTDDSQAIEWFLGLIGRQPAAAGAAQRDAPAGGAPLLSARWRVPIADDPYLAGILEQYYQLLKEHEGRMAIPTLRPLAVDDVLLMRTLRELLAVDFATGKRLWQAPPNDETKFLPNSRGQDDQLKLMVSAGVEQ